MKIILYTILLIILIVIILDCIILLKNRKSLKWWKNKYKDKHNCLFSLLQNIIPLIEYHNLIYWAHAGTLLGAIRHNNFIPWDDDVDLILLINNKEDEYNLNKFLIILEEKGYYIKKHLFGYAIHTNNCFIDLFLYHKDDNKFVGTNESVGYFPKEEYFFINEVFPLIDINMNGLNIKCPYESDKILSRFFKNYKINVVIHIPHYQSNIDKLINIREIISRYISKKIPLQLKEIK